MFYSPIMFRNDVAGDLAPRGSILYQPRRANIYWVTAGQRSVKSSPVQLNGEFAVKSLCSHSFRYTQHRAMSSPLTALRLITPTESVDKILWEDVNLNYLWIAVAQ